VQRRVTTISYYQPNNLQSPDILFNVTYVRLLLTLESVHLAQLSISIGIMSHVGGLHISWGHKGLESAFPLSNNMPCTNIPINCPVCPLSFSGNPQTIWKYNALYHLISEHSNNGIIPEIPGELLFSHASRATVNRALEVFHHGSQATMNSWLSWFLCNLAAYLPI